MSERANYFKIGLFVIAAVTLLVAGVIVFGIGAFFRKEIQVETYFQESVQGLDIGSPVKFRGVQIGQVKTMTLVRKEYATSHRYILVRMTLYPEAFLSDTENGTQQAMRREAEQGLRVRLGFQGVTGAAYIEADYLEPQKYPPLEIDWTPKYPYIPAGPSLMTRISEAVDSIMRNLEAINFQGIAQSLDQTLKTANRSLEGLDTEEIGRQLTQLISEVRETNRHLDQAVKSFDAQPALKEATAAFAGVRKAVEESEMPLRRMLGEGAAAAENLRQITEEIESSGNLRESLAHLQQAMDSLDQLLAGQKQEIETAVENFREVSENLRALSEDARENPSQTLFGEPPVRTLPRGGR